LSRRIQEHPILEFPSTKEVTIFFEGRQIIAHEGDTVASALIANGIDVLRESMNLHRPRGLFCAIGNCSSCLMDHSYSSSTIYRVLINGKEVGESTINGFLAHYHGVPVILVSGSEELEEEIKENLPEAVFHATNKTWSRFSAQSYHDALMTLAEKVHQALQNAKQLKDSSITKIGEATFTVEFLNRLAADVTSELPFVKRLSSRTIEFTMSDYDQAFHAFQAIVFMASSAMRL